MSSSLAVSSGDQDLIGLGPMDRGRHWSLVISVQALLISYSAPYIYNYICTDVRQMSRPFLRTDHGWSKPKGFAQYSVRCATLRVCWPPLAPRRGTHCEHWLGVLRRRRAALFSRLLRTEPRVPRPVRLRRRLRGRAPLGDTRAAGPAGRSWELWGPMAGVGRAGGAAAAV